MSPERHTPVSRSPFELTHRENDVLRGDLWSPVGGRMVGDACVVVCHGFKGFKDWGFFPYLCGSLVERTGHRVVGFNFSGSGIGPDLERFTETEKFARNTFSKEVADVEAVLDGLTAGRLGELPCAPAGRFAIVGHSRGGATAILVADRRPSVRAVVTWSAVASVDRYEQAFAAAIESEGTAWVVNARTGERLPLYRDVIEDIRAHREQLDVTAAAGRLRTPLLVLHGAADETVPVSEARILSSAAPGAHLEMIEGASHTMDVSHPFPGSNPRLERAIELTADHLRTHLTGEA